MLEPSQHVEAQVAPETHESGIRIGCAENFVLVRVEHVMHRPERIADRRALQAVKGLRDHFGGVRPAFLQPPMHQPEPRSCHMIRQHIEWDALSASTKAARRLASISCALQSRIHRRISGPSLP